MIHWINTDHITKMVEEPTWHAQSRQLDIQVNDNVRYNLFNRFLENAIEPLCDMLKHHQMDNLIARIHKR